MSMIIPVLLVFFFVIIYFTVKGLKKNKENVSNIEVFIFVLYMLSFLLFGVGLITHGNQHTDAIDPVDLECYIPFGGKHIITLIVYFLFFNLSAGFIWIKGHKLPPLSLVFFLIFLFIGIVVNSTILIQVTTHNTETLDVYKENIGTFLLVFTPALSLIIAIGLLIKIIKEEKTQAKSKTYKNKFLNYCNSVLANRFNESVWALLLFIPVFIVITIVLLLFGQDVNSITKVFTETTTWAFSQKMHPPILDHKGHYLCTVAAKGDPKIVKPIRLGKRHKNIIIVNRQLQIANAFEEMITDISPKLHRFIRRNYDKYGYNLSLKINSKMGSNITYLLMKPLEWIFLISLYVLCVNPEKKIDNQYQL
ncbi:hypothetical protein M4I21_10440 [Cellulophaga sp. 20_2_10]|uniref:DUF6688 domain-containing protein n=1 Tax=Cellulophaga sp. 20_2_10 TaxID=2942476 RepID=UPI00201A65A8|nr:DUF6688 family protein [Cellulophaga sp. 20_2_10]MCL5246227.1 hypothetical protein [Cellulophaga sp. 20_2_10]